VDHVGNLLEELLPVAVRRVGAVAFFNPSFLPQTELRTGGSIVIAALGIVFHASFRSDRSDLTNVVV